jgi:hypothetical protein
MYDFRFHRLRSFSIPCEKIASFLIFSSAILRERPEREQAVIYQQPAGERTRRLGCVAHLQYFEPPR